MTATGVLRKVARTGPHGRFRSLVLVLAAVPLLAGCPSTTAPTNAALPEARLTAAASRGVTPVPKVKPLPPNVAAAPVQTAALPDMGVPTPGPLPEGAVVAPLTSPASPLAAPPTVPHPSPSTTPEALVGLSEGEMAKLLGTPVSREEASPGRVWRYAKGGCRLDVFFFMDMTQSQDFRALSYDMKSNPNGPDSDRQCFAQLLAQSTAVGLGPTRAVRHD